MLSPEKEDGVRDRAPIASDKDTNKLPLATQFGNSVKNTEAIIKTARILFPEGLYEEL
jgi:hypothetical protein